MLSVIDPHMTTAGPNTADLDMAIMDKTEPTPTAQQDYQVNTSNDGIHKQGTLLYHDSLAEHPLGTQETTAKKRSINVQSCMNNHVVSEKE
jgi:hypothetical protein